MEPTQEHIKAIISSPKKFCEGTTLLHSQENFILALHVGVQTEVYALTPENAKRVAKQITNAIMDFEVNTRKIQEIPNIPSPYQGSSPEEESNKDRK